MLEDAALHVAERGYRAQSSGLFEQFGVLAVYGEGVGLTTRSVEGDHEPGAESVVVGILMGERFEFPDDVGVTNSQVGVDAGGKRPETFGFEAGDLTLSPELILEVLVGAASPE